MSASSTRASSDNDDGDMKAVRATRVVQEHLFSLRRAEAAESELEEVKQFMHDLVNDPYALLILGEVAQTHLVDPDDRTYGARRRVGLEDWVIGGGTYNPMQPPEDFLADYLAGLSRARKEQTYQRLERLGLAYEGTPSGENVVFDEPLRLNLQPPPSQADDEDNGDD
eukprot:CAMPEP_0198670850 /NCGR_PEP_ID=MMETSP1467-20131203/83180_1 /TAXON_ID=1462469 /ORGANISM="unid. sp., Strain CCMP2135" /LENGTH=167 /DNA_ID=CAMNT_0044407635 /DNA_START=6 /DNA_END=509 /DNA_ORIENTATION=-